MSSSRMILLFPQTFLVKAVRIMTRKIQKLRTLMMQNSIMNCRPFIPFKILNLSNELLRVFEISNINLLGAEFKFLGLIIGTDNYEAIGGIIFHQHLIPFNTLFIKIGSWLIEQQ